MRAECRVLREKCIDPLTQKNLCSTMYVLATGVQRTPTPGHPSKPNHPSLRDEPLGLHPTVHFFSGRCLCTSMHVPTLSSKHICAYLNAFARSETLSARVLARSKRSLDASRHIHPANHHFSCQRADLLDPSIFISPKERRMRKLSWTARSEGDECIATRISLKERGSPQPRTWRVSC
jgi:hypothetical protein